MSRHRPRLEDLKKHSPQDLAHCEGYVWHLGTRIGKGSFGEVYLGWNTAGTLEVAVKVVSKAFFKQDPKVRENLDREIRILKILRGCEYVVHLFHVQEVKTSIVLVMELCEYDLDHLVKIQPFREDDITLFLYQLAQGMKALRDHNIVHRDLKPGNILIKRHPKTHKMVIKLADFGFARHFKDEGMKPIDMTSLAGTPVFMAPEALRCVFHPGEHYDDKVDIWSIGALLYKVIVGQCGFYAQLQDIPKVLKHKGDAIAFERVGRKINYIQELPSSVNDRFQETYQAKMNRLLKDLLKLDASERMTFPEFFEFVDDLITSKVEVINLLHGTSVKIIFDPNMTAEQLVSEIHGQSGVPAESQVVFSTTSDLYLSPHTSMTPQQFSEFVEKAGGAQGHVVVYLLPSKSLVELVEPDYSCLAKLMYAVDDAGSCVSLVVEHKFADEIVHAINYMHTLQKRQIAGMEEFCKFCSRELGSFSSRYEYDELRRRGSQALAKGSLALDWLMSDLDQIAATSLPQSLLDQLKSQLQTVEQQRSEIDRLVTEMSRLYKSCQDGLKARSHGDTLATTDMAKVTATLVEEAKKLPKMRKDYIHKTCEMILKDCKIHINEVTGKVQKSLKIAFSSLSGMWELIRKAGELEEKCCSLDSQLSEVVPQCRSVVFQSLTSGKAIRETPNLRKPTTPGVVLTPPGYPNPPPLLPGATSPSGGDTSLVQSLRDEKQKFQQLYEGKNKDYQQLLVQMNTLKGQQQSQQLPVRDGRRRESSSEEERTITTGHVLSPTSPIEEKTLRTPSVTSQISLNPADARVLETLSERLKQFCVTAEKLPGVSGGKSSPSTTARSKGLYPTVPVNMDEYSVISMPGETPSTLLPQANQLMSALQVNMPKLEAILRAPRSASTATNSALIKVSKPNEYGPGDLVLFHPIRLQRSRSTAPILMHLEKPKPYILMDLTSYGAFGIRPGRMPDLIVARLIEAPRLFQFESDQEMAKELGETAGDFYRVNAEPTSVKFAPPSRPPTRPPPLGSPRQHRKPGFFRGSHGAKDFV